MLPASNKGVGMNIGFPDVCLTPMGPVPVPVPYPNMAMNAMASPFCPTILLSCVPALNMGSVIPMTLGMQPGVANPLYMMMGMYTMGNPKILLQCLPGINLTCPTTGNGMNNAVGAVLVPSVTNVFFTDAEASQGERAPRVRALTLDEITGIEGSLASSGPSVESTLLPGGVGLVALRRFSANVPSAVYQAIRELTAQGMESLVLDLRGNPGGEMRAFIELASDFLDAGLVIATMTDSDGDRTVYRGSGSLGYPRRLFVLVDHRTVSAAELFAGCLKAHGRAVVVGERTYGKGLAQALVTSPEGAAVYGTVASFELPDGSIVQDLGVEPDLVWRAGGARDAGAVGRLPDALVDALATFS